VSRPMSAATKGKSLDVASEPGELAPGPDVGRGRRSSASKRRPLNFDGAFPLLLLGSALLCYAAVLANEELASKSPHLPLWGLVGAVGAVIAGAGIYSTFLVPDQAPALDLTKDWVTVPKAEWEALRRRPTNVAAAPNAPRVVPPAGRAMPTRPPASRQAWEEDWDVDSEGFRAAAAPPAPTDLVLRQIEEIEASLQKNEKARGKKPSG